MNIAAHATNVDGDPDNEPGDPDNELKEATNEGITQVPNEHDDGSQGR